MADKNTSTESQPVETQPTTQIVSQAVVVSSTFTQTVNGGNTGKAPEAGGPGRGSAGK